ncbi:iron complex transport system permease protein [Oikeobacillus pervagus]|uniref:Iron complex transport system permease protein n=1 Tax=Oikeobacillus pervagus TaxID=1325931 RepID=A0AAJ1WFI2_9BACI|nr:iron ABC transporter permease [Oikeobacillus pervagus]MDQ0213977.1 iron complex transport system permease protein [Oikeobacillus pervagus]
MFIILSIVLLLLLMTIGVMVGPVSIHPFTVWKVVFSKLPFFHESIQSTEATIIWDIRFPRVILGVIVGAGLGIIGTAVQAVVRNSLADPYILGVSSGASVGATLVIVLGVFSFLGQYAISFAAFLGALLSTIFVFFFSQINGRISTVRLLLAGVAISMILSAITNFIVISSPRAEGIRDVMFWMMGSLAGARWEYLFIPALIVTIAFLYLWSQFRSLNLLLMGDETAVTLGVNLTSFRKKLIVITSLLTGVLVAVSGAIGFIGLVIPHIVRLLVGSDHRRVLPLSALAGASFLLLADICARIIIAPEEMPIGIITAVCGGPFFIWLLRRNSYSF